SRLHAGEGPADVEYLVPYRQDDGNAARYGRHVQFRSTEARVGWTGAGPATATAPLQAGDMAEGVALGSVDIVKISPLASLYPAERLLRFENPLPWHTGTMTCGAV